MGIDQQERTPWLTQMALRMALRLPDAVEQAGRRAASLMGRAGLSEHLRWTAFVRGCSEDLGRRLWFLIVDTEEGPPMCPGCFAKPSERCAIFCPVRERDERDEYASDDNDEEPAF